TPSSFSALLGSMLLMRACGCDECRSLPTSRPGKVRSSVYLPAPVVLPAASTMGMGLPMTEKSVTCSGHSFLLRLNRRLDCLIHLRIAGAAAQIAAQGFADFCVSRIWLHRKQMFDRHHESGSAKSALRAAPVAVSFLDRGERAMFGDAFDGGDLLAFAARSQQSTRQHRSAIKENRTGAAGGIVAAPLGASELQVLAQHV